MAIEGPATWSQCSIWRRMRCDRPWSCCLSQVRGGELRILAVDASSERIHRGAEPLGTVLQRVAPRPGRLVEFDGRLLHAIAPWEAAGPRVSAVHPGAGQQL